MGLSLLAMSTRNQSYGLGLKDMVLGIREGQGLITLHSGSPGVWELPEHRGW